MSLLVGTPPVLTLLSKITTRRTSHTLSLCVGRSLFLRTIQIRDALRRDPTGFLHSPPNHDQRGVRRDPIREENPPCDSEQDGHEPRQILAAG